MWNNPPGLSPDAKPLVHDRRVINAIAAFVLGLLFLASSALVRGGLHDEPSPLALVWLFFGLTATRAAGALWRPQLWPGWAELGRRSGALVTALGWIAGCFILFGPPYDPHDRDERYQARCRTQLEYLGSELDIYADDNGGHYPDRPEALFPAGVRPDAFVCQSTRLTAATGATPADVADAFASGGHNSYIYVAKGVTTATTQPDTVLMYEPPTNHTRDHPGLHVLYAGDCVEYLQGDQAYRFLADQRQREDEAAKGHSR